MATYGSTSINGVLDGNLQFLNQGYGLTGYPDYGGVDGDPVNGSAFIFLIKLGGSQGPIWLDTDLNKTTGYNGYDYHIIWSRQRSARCSIPDRWANLVATLTDYVYVPAVRKYPAPVPLWNSLSRPAWSGGRHRPTPRSAREPLPCLAASLGCCGGNVWRRHDRRQPWRVDGGPADRRAAPIPGWRFPAGSLAGQ